MATLPQFRFNPFTRLPSPDRSPPTPPIDERAAVVDLIIASGKIRRGETNNKPDKAEELAPGELVLRAVAAQAAARGGR